MKKLLLSVIALSIAACSQSAEQTAANNAAAADANETAQAAVPSLEGEWVVEQLSGKEPDQIWPMTAEVTKDKFTIVSECRRMSWAMKQDRNLVQFTPAPGVECGRVRSPAEIVADKAVKLANIVVFSDEGRSVQVSGAGGTVSMTRR
jgi:hypothetical protein